jgi:hypothetical protein
MRLATTGFVLAVLFLLTACGGGSKSSFTSQPVYELALAFSRLDQTGPDPFTVTATLRKNGAGYSGQTLTVLAPRGSLSAVTDMGDGTYTFSVTPVATGVYPVTVSYQNVSVKRSAVVLDGLGTSAGQPLAVPGDFVNTEGYEDGVTITPDGEYLFVQYGPVYFSGIIYLSTICADTQYSLYNLNDCNGRDDSAWVFNTIGPYNNSQRPAFPAGRISGGAISHLSSIVVPGVVNGLMVPPTVFYGFKRQADGSYAEPFKLAFDDQDKAIQSPYGLSFQMTGSNTANFTVSWNDSTNNLGDDGADVYAGTITMGQDSSLGTVTYNGDIVATVNPAITPVGFSDHSGVQGNSHLYADSTGAVKSIWTDDEVNSHDITVYTLDSGSFPNGTWTKVILPAKINTAQEESQPFFTGSQLYLRRGNKIVSHAYLGGGYQLNTAWDDEVTILASNTNTEIGSIIAIGEPTIATIDGNNYLFFAYGTVRALGTNSSLPDINMDAGFVRLQ